MLHKKNVVYFFRNAQKAKKSAKTELSTGKKTAVILKTVASDIATTSELGFGKRRLAHVLGMYGTILFWIASVVLIFKYSDGIISEKWPVPKGLLSMFLGCIAVYGALLGVGQLIYGNDGSALLIIIISIISSIGLVQTWK